MAGVTIKFELAANASFVLTESEMRALDGLTGYGDDAFLEVFKAKLGTAYIRDHEAGLRSFFKSVRREVLPAIRMIDQARADLAKANRARAETARAKAEQESDNAA